MALEGLILSLTRDWGGANGTYNLPAGTITGGIGIGSSFTLTNGGDTILLVNQSGSTINTQSQALRYLASMYPSGSQIATAVSDKISSGLKPMLGGTLSSARARLAKVDASILSTPTGVLSTDVATLDGEIVTSPSGVLETDVQTVNSLVNGTASGSTVQARLNTLFGNIDGSNGSSGNLNSKLSTQITALEGSAVQLSTAISDVNVTIGGSGTTISRSRAVNALLDGVQSLSGLSHFTVSAAASTSGGMVSMIGNDGNGSQTYAVDTSGTGINIGDGTGGTTAIANGATFTLSNSGSGNTITFVNNSGSSITSANALATYLASAYPANASLSSNTSTKAITLENILGGLNYSAMSNAIAIDTMLLANPTGVVTNDVQTINSLLDGTASGSTVQARIGNPTIGGSGSNLVSVLGGSGDVAALIGDPGSGTIIGNLGGTSVQDGLNTLSTSLVGNTNFSSSLVSRISSINSSLDGGLNSLPNDSTFAGVGTGAVSDGSGGVNITISSGLGGSNGTYNLPGGTITGGIGNGSTFTLTNGGDNLVLVNQSGSTINNQSQALRYLASMYPSGSQIATAVSDKISNGLNTMLGGTLSSTRARLARVDASILNTPTGVLSTDVATLAGEIVITPGSTREADVQILNTLINGTASGSTVQSRLGAPTVNGISSNLSAVIGGAGSDLAARLGDPFTAGSGLSSLVKASSASNGANVWTDISSFTNASDLNSQLAQFLALFNNASWSNNANTSITFTFSSPPTSLADVVNAAVSTS